MAEQSTTEQYGENELRALLSGPAVGVPQHADEETRKTFTDRRMGQREAYGQFVADGPIYWPGTGILVFAEGQQVPVEHVEKWMLEDAGMVHRVASPMLARAGRRFPASKGGQVTGGDGAGDVAVMPVPTTTPPAPSGEEAAAADEGGTKDTKQRAAKSTPAKKQGDN